MGQFAASVEMQVRKSSKKQRNNDLISVFFFLFIYLACLYSQKAFTC